MSKLLVIAGPLSGYSLELLRSVARAWPCTVHVIHEPLPASIGFSHEQVRFEDFECLNWAEATSREIVRFIRRCEPNAVLIHGTRPARALALALAILPTSVPVLFVSDANIYDLVSQRGRLLPRLAVYRALFSRVPIALSLGLSNELALRLLGARKVVLLPVYAIDYAALERAREQAPAFSSAERQLVIVARQVEVKNLAAAIEAVSSDPELREGLMLSFVGDGPLRPSLEALARRLRVKTRFLGALPRPQVGAALGHADALLLPSTCEPWGIVVCEALGMGIPVIASPAVGAATSLAGQTGAIVVARSPSEPDLAEALRDFLRKSDQLTAAARSSAPRIRQLYSLPDVAARLAGLLEDLARGKPVST
jgi:glycosyltransferase involved in cell wall biosynthesis